MALKYNSTELIELARTKKEICIEYGMDWPSYYNGFLDGFATYHCKDKEREGKETKDNSKCMIHNVNQRSELACTNVSHRIYHLTILKYKYCPHCGIDLKQACG